jgi:hypothetical protein
MHTCTTEIVVAANFILRSLNTMFWPLNSALIFTPVVILGIAQVNSGTTHYSQTSVSVPVDEPPSRPQVIFHHH